MATGRAPKDANRTRPRLQGDAVIAKAERRLYIDDRARLGSHPGNVEGSRYMSREPRRD